MVFKRRSRLYVFYPTGITKSSNTFIFPLLSNYIDILFIVASRMAVV
jgi:hypothetical protein